MNIVARLNWATELCFNPVANNTGEKIPSLVEEGYFFSDDWMKVLNTIVY